MNKQSSVYVDSDNERQEMAFNNKFTTATFFPRLSSQSQDQIPSIYSLVPPYHTKGTQNCDEEYIDVSRVQGSDLQSGAPIIERRKTKEVTNEPVYINEGRRDEGKWKERMCIFTS